MGIERGSEPQSIRFRKPAEDAVVTVRRALERMETGTPTLPGDNEAAAEALVALMGRLDRLKARGVRFDGVELTAAAGKLPGSGPVPVPS